MMRPLALPLFPEPLPFARPSIAGWAVGDRVAFGPLAARRGRVITMLPSLDRLVISTDDGTIADIEPARCRKIGGAAP